MKVLAKIITFFVAAILSVVAVQRAIRSLYERLSGRFLDAGWQGEQNDHTHRL